MLHRNRKEADFHAGKWNGLGGKLEKNESPIEAAAREIFEESGLRLPPSAFSVLGVLQFPNFKPQKHEDWICYVVTARVPDEKITEVKPAGPEGDLSWIERAEVLQLNLWEGDKLFIPHVLENKPFVGTIWYENGNVVRNWIAALNGS